MKKQFFLAGVAVLLAAPAFAQSEKTTIKNDATGAKTTTEVKVRDNGTMKVETDTRTGRTKAGEVVNDAAQETKMVGKKVGNGTEKAAKKTVQGTKKVGKKAIQGTKKAGQAIDNTAEKGVEKVKDAVE